MHSWSRFRFTTTERVNTPFGRSTYELATLGSLQVVKAYLKQKGTAEISTKLTQGARILNRTLVVIKNPKRTKKNVCQEKASANKLTLFERVTGCAWIPLADV